MNAMKENYSDLYTIETKVVVKRTNERPSHSCM